MIDSQFMRPMLGMIFTKQARVVRKKWEMQMIISAVRRMPTR